MLEAELSRTPARRRCGRVAAADGGALLVTGLGDAARLGDRILLAPHPDAEGVTGEIVALTEAGARAMALGPGDRGVGLGDPVWLAPDAPLRPSDAWLGRVIGAYGAPLDGRPLPEGDRPAPVRRAPPPAATRGGLGPRLSTGLAATDTILPLARGQRIGVFAGSGVGKSLLLSTLAKGVEADVVVFGLIGERGRELNEFIAEGLGPEGMRRAIVVAATSDESPLARRRAAWTAMAVAEHFRDAGRHVLLILDSLTRFAEAHREIALTAGETPSLRAYPPSTANMIAALAERAGPAGRRKGDGAITGIFSVLVAGSDMEEPVADITRGVLDGHVVLDRAIAERGRFPAIDIGRSVSRALPRAASEAENAMIAEVRRLIGAYERAEPMIQTGLYQPGVDATLDRAVALFPALDAFVATRAEAGEGFARLEALLRADETSASV
ncbi:FliI/YscN family ATPase [Pikeienuella piscinae]|uniref:FliI/YscN family ATPase n=1 Tax=Pikeienuella piscinae TaxID=2748098 RepID=A0A7M3T7G4_9RHOB|nr:FliI/YscN family ATPase [Pikeienuella piscinae]QIE57945.1 FliI/YscN family ATPase [Pikeienuella piscinae]